MTLPWLPAALLLGPLLAIALAAVFGARRARAETARAVAALGASVCPSCHHGFSPADAVAAHAASLERKRASIAEALGSSRRPRVRTDWSFPCPSCRAELTFQPGAHALRSA